MPVAFRRGPAAGQREIYADAKQGGDLWTHLPRSRRKRRRRCPRQEGRGRGRIPNQRMIDKRPAQVETRRHAGHWEGDLINGAHETGNLVTLVERTTRFTLVGRTDSKEATEVRAVIESLLAPMQPSLRLSVTFDNGKEFAQHEALARRLGLDVYFAKPYHSWERGTNENTNGLIRRLHPAGIIVTVLADGTFPDRRSWQWPTAFVCWSGHPY